MKQRPSLSLLRKGCNHEHLIFYLGRIGVNHCCQPVDYFILRRFTQPRNNGVVMQMSTFTKLPTACAEGVSVNSLARELIERIDSERRAYRKESVSPFLKVNHVSPKREGSAAAVRYAEAAAYIKAHVNVTVEDLLANTSYTKLDLRNDMRKGHISFARSH